MLATCDALYQHVHLHVSEFYAILIHPAGMVGGSVKNAALALSELLASLHYPNGTVAIPGFYE